MKKLKAFVCVLEFMDAIFSTLRYLVTVLSIYFIRKFLIFLLSHPFPSHIYEWRVCESWKTASNNFNNENSRVIWIWMRIEDLCSRICENDEKKKFSLYSSGFTKNFQFVEILFDRITLKSISYSLILKEYLKNFLPGKISLIFP